MKIYIQDVHNEDALNIVNSSFQVSNLYIKNTKSDAIDIDFSSGKLSDTVLSDIGYMSGADAIDLSGSSVHIKNVKISNVSDKGLSLGENSEAFFENSAISNALVGVASKDGSRVDVKNLKFDEISLSHAMAYTKKKNTVLA